MTRQNLTLKQPFILSVDTSSKATSLAVARGGILVGLSGELQDQKRSERLWTEVGALLAAGGMTIGDVDVFAVCLGPGGFTGLRVGMAAVKGFAAAANKPIVGVTSLEAAAFAAGPAEMVCAMVNAYKDEVYSQLFSFDDSGVPLTQNDPMVSSLATAVERVADLKELVFTGDGAEAEREALRSIAASLIDRRWATKESERGRAESISRLAFLKYARGEMQSAGSVKACYVRQSEAELKLSMGLLGSKIKRSMKAERR